MNFEIEKEFVKTYINIKFQNRLLYELSSLKKRINAISRFSHGAQTMLKDSLKKKVVTNLSNFQNNKDIVYVISFGENDGVTMPLSNALNFLESSYMPIIIIGKDYSIIKEEVEDSRAQILYLEYK